MIKLYIGHIYRTPINWTGGMLRSVGGEQTPQLCSSIIIYETPQFDLWSSITELMISLNESSNPVMHYVAP